MIGTRKFLRHLVFLAGIFFVQNSFGQAQEPVASTEPAAATATTVASKAPPKKNVVKSKRPVAVLEEA